MPSSWVTRRRLSYFLDLKPLKKDHPLVASPPMSHLHLWDYGAGQFSIQSASPSFERIYLCMADFCLNAFQTGNALKGRLFPKDFRRTPGQIFSDAVAIFWLRNAHFASFCRKKWRVSLSWCASLDASVRGGTFGVWIHEYTVGWACYSIQSLHTRNGFVNETSCQCATLAHKVPWFCHHRYVDL